MNALKVLDVTLRDGGCLNDFNFGQTYMEKILEALEKSGVNIIELGYIDEINGSDTGRTQFTSEKVIPKSILKNKKNSINYVAMIDYGKYDVDKLEMRSASGIDGIRMAFHKENRTEIISLGRKIIEKGYEFYIQPMITLRYSDSELLELINLVNMNLPDAAGFYIVDSFGEMRPNDMARILNLVDHNLISSMTIGFHSHNNLQLSYSNAMTMLKFPTTRDLIIDCSIMGMGKGAGNLNTELLLEHLNLFYGKNYKISPLLVVIDGVINQLHNEFYWGYAPEYYLSAIKHCSPSYARYYYSKHMLPINRVSELLDLISEEKKISFDREYAEELYRTFNSRIKIDDTDSINMIKKEFEGRTVLLVAPGKSIEESIGVIKVYLNDENIITIGLNIIIDTKQDYILTTRSESYEDALSKGVNIIVPSNISRANADNIFVIDYSKWVYYDGNTRDSSAVIALNVLKNCGVKRILLAGLDGFSSGINDNYVDENMRHPITEAQANAINEFYSGYLNEIAEMGIEIEFVTKSKYTKM